MIELSSQPDAMRARWEHAPKLEFKRSPRPILVEALSPGGSFSFLTDLVRRDTLWDLGFRDSRVDVYRGRSCVMNILATNKGRQIALRVLDPKYRQSARAAIKWSSSKTFDAPRQS